MLGDENWAELKGSTEPNPKPNPKPNPNPNC